MTGGTIPDTVPAADPPDPPGPPGPGRTRQWPRPWPWRRREKPRRSWFRVSWWVWLARVILLGFTFVVLVISATAFQVWHVARQDHHPRSDVILVLGASQYNGRPSEVFAARLDHARALYDKGVAPRIVTVGGSQPGDAYTEAKAGANYLAAHGVPRSALVPVEQGNDTLVSLRAAAVAMNKRDWHSAVLVTDPWHSLRSRQMARDLHIKAQTSPVRTGPAVRARATEVRYIARETMGYLFYRLFHRASPPGTGPDAV